MEEFLLSSEPPPSLENIEAIESKYDLILPASYKEFLMTNNGGVALSEDRRFRDSVFFSVANTANSLSSEIYERRNKNRIPIGSNLAGVYISIDASSGEVFLAKTKVADDFESFVRSYLLKAK